MVKTLSLGDDDAFHSVEEGWNCEHCTLVNSYETNFCSACYKTSSITRVKKSNPPAEKMVSFVYFLKFYFYNFRKMLRKKLHCSITSTRKLLFYIFCMSFFICCTQD